MCIMAQLGCHVPADAATFRIPDRIFSRVSNRDCIETNSSTFMIEMQETSFILGNVGPTSLVIIDELGRGTSVDEGSAICWAVSERLLTGTTSFVLLATHFRQMTRLAELHPCAANHHFLSQEEDGQTVYTHRLAAGKAQETDLQYGIDLAAKMLPAGLVERARQMSRKIRSRSEVVVTPDQQLDTACLQTFVELKRLRRLGLRGADLAAAVGQVRERFLREAADRSSVEEGTGSGEDVERGGGEGATADNGNSSMEEQQDKGHSPVSEDLVVNNRTGSEVSEQVDVAETREQVEDGNKVREQVVVVDVGASIQAMEEQQASLPEANIEIEF